MGTPFEEIYKRAIFKFTDFNFLDYEVELKAKIMHQHLLSAIVDFFGASTIPLTYGKVKDCESECDYPDCDYDYNDCDDDDCDNNDNGGCDDPGYDGVTPATDGSIIDDGIDVDNGYDDDTEPELEPDIDQYAFDYELGIEEQEILALGLVFHWLSSKVHNSELLRNVMHNRDYKSYSPANLLKEMQNLRANIKQEFVGRINTYSFRNSNIATMRIFRG